MNDSLGLRPMAIAPVGWPSSPMAKWRRGGSYGGLITGLSIASDVNSSLSTM
jgi:hypothetical protein